MLSFRPLDLELMVPSVPTLIQVNWSVMGGLGVLLGRSKDDDER
jgi:hypothetical protein